MRINIVFFLILITCLNVFSKSTTAQISLHIEKGDLETVFKAIEKQTDYSFMYEVSLLKGSGVVSIDVRDAGLEEVLDEVFRGQPFYYEVISKTIVVKEKVRNSVELPQDEKKTILIKGKVTDKQNIPLVGVSVRIKGTSIGTLTDQNGNYTITADPNGVIIFSYVGYQTFNIMINRQAEINMTMMENTSQLDETVVKGYYKTSKTLNTGNVSTIQSGEISRQPVSDPMLALQGRVAGLYIQQQNGVPGREVIIRLRGQNSLDNGNNPLFIVDGMQFSSSSPTIRGRTGISNAPLGGNASPFNFLNPSDIESITVLKDADATAIYGSRGANGVILITTKKGNSGKVRMDINYYTGVNNAVQRVNFMTTPAYLQMRREAFKNDGKDPGVTDYDLNGTWDTTSYTNWQDMFIGGTAKVNNITASLSGGNQNTNFRIGSSYRNEGTIFPGNNGMEKTGMQFSLDHLSENRNFRMSLSGSYTNSTNNLPQATATSLGSFDLAPNLPAPYNSDGSLKWSPNDEWVNPMAAFLRSSNETGNNLISNLILSYRPLKNLEIKTDFSFNQLNFNQTNITPFTSYNPINTSASVLRTNEFLKNESEGWIIEPQISYSSNFLRGKLDVLLGSTFQSNEQNYLAMSARGFSTDELIESFAAGTTVSTRGRSLTVYKYNALYARAGYSYMNRYVINLTGRRDGSSRFGTENRFGNFGAVGAAWIFSNEGFVKSTLPFLNYGKLRASYGSTGNDQLPDYQYLDTYSADANFYQNISSLTPTQLTNQYYGWERVNKLELGIELGIFENNLSFNASYYSNRTKNQLVQYGLPVVTGFTSVRANIPAVIGNSGFEIDITSVNIQSAALSWSTSANITIPKTKLISYPNIEASSYATRYVVGMPLSLFLGYHFTGLSPNTGIFTFEDKNGDGALSSAVDYQFREIGQTFFGGIQNNIRFRKFELDFFFQFVKQEGRGYFTSGTSPGFYNLAKSNQPDYLIGSKYQQTVSQSNLEINRASSQFNTSDGSITDASFIRLKNLSLSWSIPIAKNFGNFLRSIKVYYQAQNLLTISNYQGYDPESPSNGIVLPSLRSHTFGLHASF